MIKILINIWTASLYDVLLYFACFVVSTYVIFIWAYWIPIAYASSIIYSFRRLQKTFSSSEPKEKWPHAGQYIYNGRQIEFFHMDRLTGPYRGENVARVNNF